MAQTIIGQKESESTGSSSTGSSSVEVFSVEQLNVRIRQLLEGTMGVVWVQGEISNFKPHTSGHFYFSIKDAKSQISAIMFRGFNAKLKFRPTDGLQVLVRARVTVYEPRGTYQLACEYMEPVGAGALQKQFEQIRDRLKAEGLFDPARKKQIPLFPSRIAVVTSPTGAAIQDILNIMRRRAPGIEVVVVPTLVQGPQCAEHLQKAFQYAARLKPDVIIIGRGGGSMEDLWGFNDEGLARLIAASPIPVISAVGHEIDFTICDFVSDLRAPTPSAAAELVAQSTVELKNRIIQKERLITVAMSKILHGYKLKWQGLSRQLVDPRRKVADLIQRNDELMSRLLLAIETRLDSRFQKIEILRRRLKDPRHLITQTKTKVKLLAHALTQAVDRKIEAKHMQVAKVMSMLDSLSPLKVVDRGYAIVKKDNELIKTIEQVKAQDEILIRVSNGTIAAEVKSVSGK